MTETLSAAQEDQLPIFAAGFSYYLLFSLIPLFFVVLTVVGKIIEKGSASHAILQQLTLLFDVEVASSFRDILRAAAQMNLAKAGVVGSLFAIYGASRIFVVLQSAISQIWDKGVVKKKSFKAVLKSRLHSALLLMIPISLVMLLFVVDTVFSTFKHLIDAYFMDFGFRHVVPVMASSFSLVLYTGVFALINRLLPISKPTWKEVWVGGIVTTLVFSLGRVVFTTIFHFSRISSLFGAAGSLILLLMWIYFSMMVFLFGSEFTCVYSKHQRARKMERK